jgi:hypothetical protein
MEPPEPVEPTGPSRHLPPGAGAPAPGGKQRGRGRQRQKSSRTPDWWHTRNVLGVLNWELVLIVVVALVAGVAATIASSIVGVR